MLDTQQKIGEVWQGTQCAWNAFMAAKVYDIGVRLATALLIMAKFTLQPTMPPKRAACCSLLDDVEIQVEQHGVPGKLGVFST